MPVARKIRRTASDAVLEQWPAAYRDWVSQFHFRLVWGGLDDAQAAAELERQLQAVRDSGEDPAGLLGEPNRFGQQRAASLLDQTQRLERDLPVFRGSQLLRIISYLCFGLFVLAAVFLGFRDGWLNHSWQLWQGLCFLVVPWCAALGLWGWISFRMGRLRTAAACWTGAAIALVAFGWLVSVLDTERVLPVANLVVGLGAAGMIVLTAVLPRREPAAQDDPVLGDEQWFTALERILRGRYLFTRAQARAEVAQLRAHLQQQDAEGKDEPPMSRRAEGGARREFGPVAGYAAILAATCRSSIVRQLRLRSLALIVTLVFYGWIILTTWFDEGPGFGAWVMSAAWLMLLILMLRDLMPHRRQQAIASMARRRRQDAAAQERALDGHDD